MTISTYMRHSSSISMNGPYLAVFATAWLINFMADASQQQLEGN